MFGRKCAESVLRYIGAQSYRFKTNETILMQIATIKWSTL